MTELNNRLEDFLPSFFQSHIKVVIGEGTVFEGVLILFSMSKLNFRLMVKMPNGNIRKFIFPRPFSCDKYDRDHILCDFRYSTLAGEDKEILSTLRKIKIYEKSRYFDTVAEIVRIPPEHRE